MKRGQRLPKHQAVIIDQVVAEMFAADPRVKTGAVQDRLARKFKITVGDPVVWRRLRKLRENGTEPAHVEPHMPEVAELDTPLSFTSLSNGKMRIALSIDLEPKWGGAIVAAVGAVLASRDGAERVTVAQDGTQPLAAS